MPDVLPPDFDPGCEPRYDGIYGLPTGPDEAALVLLPIPWEATISFRARTALAPSAILAASHQVELYDVGDKVDA